MDTTFTEKEFYAEIIRFRQLFGTKDWWKKSVEQRDACVQGLTIMYLNIVNADGSFPSEENRQRYATLFNATIVEYQRRATMIGKLT